MQINLLKSKIHKASVTKCDINYEGSISIDENIIKAANLREFEKVMISNINNAERFETYIIKAPAGSKEIGLNGAAARLVALGDRIIIFSFASMTADEAEIHKPVIIVLNENNDIVKIK